MGTGDERENERKKREIKRGTNKRAIQAEKI